jgi:hypothetical protein
VKISTTLNGKNQPLWLFFTFRTCEMNLLRWFFCIYFSPDLALRRRDGGSAKREGFPKAGVKTILRSPRLLRLAASSNVSDQERYDLSYPRRHLPPHIRFFLNLKNRANEDASFCPKAGLAHFLTVGFGRFSGRCQYYSPFWP